MLTVFSVPWVPLSVFTCWLGVRKGIQHAKEWLYGPEHLVCEPCQTMSSCRKEGMLCAWVCFVKHYAYLSVFCYVTDICGIFRWESHVRIFIESGTGHDRSWSRWLAQCWSLVIEATQLWSLDAVRRPVVRPQPSSSRSTIRLVRP